MREQKVRWHLVRKKINKNGKTKTNWNSILRFFPACLRNNWHFKSECGAWGSCKLYWSFYFVARLNRWKTFTFEWGKKFSFWLRTEFFDLARRISGLPRHLSVLVIVYCKFSFVCLKTTKLSTILNQADNNGSSKYWVIYFSINKSCLLPTSTI